MVGGGGVISGVKGDLSVQQGRPLVLTGFFEHLGGALQVLLFEEHLRGVQVATLLGGELRSLARETGSLVELGGPLGRATLLVELSGVESDPGFSIGACGDEPPTSSGGRC